LLKWNSLHLFDYVTDCELVALLEDDTGMEVGTLSFIEFSHNYCGYHSLKIYEISIS